MIFVLMGILGLCFGSFISAVVWRLYKQENSKEKTKNTSIVKGRSMCPHCAHRLGAADLIPVLSWIELRGRCRYCQAKIGWQYPATEIITAGLFIGSYLAWPYSFSGIGTVAFVVWLFSLVLLISLVIYDLRWMLLPDKLILPLTAASLVLVGLLCIERGDPNFVIWPGLGALLLSGLFWGLFQVSKGRWIGGGDVKLAIPLGLISGGVLESILLLFIASLIGTLVSVPLLLIGKGLSHKLPFGPFLITAATVVFWWGEPVISWYKSLF